MSASTSCGHPSHTLWSASYQEATYALQKICSLLDDLIGALLKEQRHLDAKRLGGLSTCWGFQGSSGVHLPIADISQLYSSGSMRYKPAAAALRPDGASTKLRRFGLGRRGGC
jgi:hypothetical protein